MSARKIPNSSRRQITVIVDGGGAVITTGVKAFVTMPVAGVWRKWTILSVDAASPISGSITFDVWVEALAGYPPAVANSITASAKPTLTTATFNSGSTLTGWVLGFNAGDVVAFNVDTATSVTKVALMLEFD